MHAVDSSVFLAAMNEGDGFHRECNALLDQANYAIYDHGLAEVFNTLTSGKIKPRLPASIAARLVRANFQESDRVLDLPVSTRLTAFEEAESRGVRGGPIFDYLHLVAARHHGMQRLYTLNMSHFLAFWRPGDPEIVHP